MESEEEIKRKFDKLFTEALQSPLPKLKYRGPLKKNLSTLNNKGANLSINTNNKKTIPGVNRPGPRVNHLGAEQQASSNTVKLASYVSGSVSGIKNVNRSVLIKALASSSSSQLTSGHNEDNNVTWSERPSPTEDIQQQDLSRRGKTSLSVQKIDEIIDSNVRPTDEEICDQSDDLDLPCSGHVSKPHIEDDQCVKSSLSLPQEDVVVDEEDEEDLGLPSSRHVTRRDSPQKQDSKNKHEHRAPGMTEPKRTNVRTVQDCKVQVPRKQPGRKAKQQVKTKPKKRGHLSQSKSEVVSSRLERDTQDEERGPCNNGPHQDVECKDGDEDDNDDDDVSSLIGEDEEFFLHKPRPHRNSATTKCWKLNIDGLWSKIIIHKSDGITMERHSDVPQRFLRRNLRKCKCQFSKYISQMKLQQEDQKLGSKESSDKQSAENSKQMEPNKKRGQKRKSVGDAAQTSSKDIKVKKSRQKVSTDTKTQEAPKVKQSKVVLGAGGDKSQHWKKPPPLRRNSKSSEKRPQIQKQTRKKSVSGKSKQSKKPCEAAKINKNKKALTSGTSGDDDVLLFDSEERHSSSKQKSKAVNKTKQQRKSSMDAKTRTSSSKWIINDVSSLGSSRDSTTRVVRHYAMKDTDVSSKLMPLSSHMRSPDIAAGGVADDGLPSAAASDLAIGDPLVAGALREDWGVGIRSLFGNVGGKAHCGGIWKAIIDEHS